MAPWARADIAIISGVAATFAAGAMSAVALSNVPLGAVIGVTIGILATFLMWPRKRKTDEEQR